MEDLFFVAMMGVLALAAITRFMIRSRLPSKVSQGGRLPRRGTVNAAGLDLFLIEDVTIPPGKTVLARTGLSFALPPGTCGLVLPRGSSTRRGLVVQGLVDSDFRGEVVVPILNASAEQISVLAGQAPAQLLILPYQMMLPMEMDDLGTTDRGDGAFGSTGAAVSGKA